MPPKRTLAVLKTEYNDTMNGAAAPEPEPAEPGIPPDVPPAAAPEPEPADPDRRGRIGLLADWLLKLAEITDPWEYAHFVEANFSESERPGTPDRWLNELVGRRPALEQDALIQLGKKIWGIPVQTMREVVKAQRKKPVARDPLDLLKNGATAAPFHLAQDVIARTLFYGLPIDEDVVIVASTRDAFSKTKALPDGRSLAVGKPRPSLSRGAARRWVEREEETDIPVGRVLDDLRAWLSRYIFFADARTALLVAAWIFGTWLYQGFEVYPYLVVKSAQKRCGKSRLLKLISYGRQPRQWLTVPGPDAARLDDAPLPERRPAGRPGGVTMPRPGTLLAVGFDDAAAQGQAQARALALRLGREEWLEDPRLHVSRHSRAGVTDGEADALRLGDVPGGHRQPRFLAFLKRVARRYHGRDLHIVLDNSSTHSTPAVQAWLAAHRGSASTSRPRAHRG